MQIFFMDVIYTKAPVLIISLGTDLPRSQETAR